MHTSSAVCLKRDSDVLFNDEEIIVSAADNCNRLQVKKEPNDWMLSVLSLSCVAKIIFFFLMCQVRDGRTGSVLFQTEEMSSRIRCTCLCKQPFAVAVGQEDGTVQVKTC